MDTLEQNQQLDNEQEIQRALRLQAQLGHLTLFELEHPLIFRGIE